MCMWSSLKLKSIIIKKYIFDYCALASLLVSAMIHNDEDDNTMIFFNNITEFLSLF